MKLNLDHHQAPYAPMFAGWLKKWGSKPTAENLMIAHHLVSTRGGKHAVMTAMCLRPEGAHDWQVYEATQLNKYVGGRPQYLHTYRNRACDAALFERDTNKAPVSAALPFGGNDKQGNTHTKMVLTPKGAAELKKHQAAGTVDAAFRRASVAKLAAFEAQQVAKRVVAAEKAKATRDARKAAKLSGEPKPVTDLAADAPQVEAQS